MKGKALRSTNRYCSLCLGQSYVKMIQNSNHLFIGFSSLPTMYHSWISNICACGTSFPLRGRGLCWAKKWWLSSHPINQRRGTDKAQSLSFRPSRNEVEHLSKHLISSAGEEKNPRTLGRRISKEKLPGGDGNISPSQIDSLLLLSASPLASSPA